MSFAKEFELNRSGTSKNRVFTTATVLLSFLLLLASSSAVASADQPSALDQYVEQVPTGTGGETISGLQQNEPVKELGKQAYQQFQTYGNDGVAAAELASAGNQTGGDSNPTGEEGAQRVDGVGPSNKGSTDRVDLSGGSGLGQVLETATGISGSGSSPIPFLVAVGAILSMAFVAFNRNRRTG